MKNNLNSSFEECMNSYELLFSYSDWMDLEEMKFLYIPPNKNIICIFCLNKNPVTTFKDNSHVIPYLLGNKYLMHKEECEACNTKFGKTIETELANFSEKFRVINGQKNRNKNKPDYLKYQAKSQKAFLQTKKIDNRVLLEVTGDRPEDIFNEHENRELSLTFETKYRDSDVYKAFMKIIYGVIPPDNRKDFSILRSWIDTEDYNIKLLHKLIMYQTILTTYHPDNLIINVFRKRKTLKNIFLKKNNFDYFALIGFGNVLFDIPLLSDKTLQRIKSRSKNNSLIIPLLSGIAVNEMGAIRTTLEMSNTERRTEKMTFSLISNDDSK